MTDKATDTDESPEYTVSVVMPSYHTGPILLRSIKSVLAEKEVIELVLVDNGNSNFIRGKIEEISRKNKKLRIIVGQGNIGFARACNLGEREVTGDYLLIMNPDCVVAKGAIANTVAALKRYPKAWVAGCKLVTPEGNEVVGNRRNIMSFHNMISEWFKLYKHIFMPRVELFETIAPKGTSYIPAISTSFMLMEHKRYKEIGGMDKNYFLYMEDMDFCFKVSDMGGKIIYVSNVEVVHYGTPKSVSQIFLNKHKAKGLAYYFRKNYNGAYFPGILIFITGIIYLRYITQTLLTSRKKKQPEHKEENDRSLRFLETYKKFQSASKEEIREARYYIVNRAPILITDVTSPIGLCILRRLLAANIEVIALYKDKPIDIYHPKLSWMQGSLDEEKLNFTKEYSPKTLICTSQIQRLARHLENASEAGVKRLICFSSITIFSEKPNNKARGLILAEQDITRISARFDMDYTILRAPLVYGMAGTSDINTIYKFIKKFGFFPIANGTTEICPPVHADDLAIAAIQILNIEQTYRKNYNLAGGRRIIYKDMVKKLFEISRKKTAISEQPILRTIFNIYSRLQGQRDINNEVMNYEVKEHVKSYNEAINDFGYSARSFLGIEDDDFDIG